MLGFNVFTSFVKENFFSEQTGTWIKWYCVYIMDSVYMKDMWAPVSLSIKIKMCSYNGHGTSERHVDASGEIKIL